ncbi:hypothetical protein ISF_04873 [Cordyceps fumosorosea ARSEF 2679]|uniref:2EXR domain-containing protein n=1 Tax=Cordyceps fumosorosea (strain ARSEF 2679) TaxID=1081104 RepID=A0A167VUP0_CORFA|nr:hypothetical protein ISF_04873 [Cordyceps fumosorosea ARSEF 2679]OAA62997.1 hypothetical protein ISF_04873 [Cordyceps fumosorosea ARSEF 2679]
MPANGAAPSPVFTLFTRLPCELRLAIWEHALPSSRDFDLCAVYFFRDWKWNPHEPSSSRPVLETDDELGEDVVNPHVPLPHLPHVSVCHEARSVALRWAAARQPHNRLAAGLQVHERAWDEDVDAGGRLAVRAWQPRRDAVYVGRERWDDFCRRPCTFPFDGQAAVYYGTVDGGYAAASHHHHHHSLFGRPAPRGVEIRTLAIPAGADIPGRALAGLLHCLPNLERLRLVYGPLPQPHEREDEPLVPRRWTLRSADGVPDGVRVHHYTDAPMGGGRYAPREEDGEPLRGEALRRHVDEVERMLLREVKRCEVESEARDAVESHDRLPFTLEAAVFERGY